MNKKGVITMQFLVIMLIAILSFFVIFTFINIVGDTVTSELEEQRCKSYLKAKSYSIAKMADFLMGLSNTCKVDDISSDVEKKEKVFELIAKRARSCWERYGSGELDFMSNYDTTGEYCFPCSKIAFEEKNTNYDYEEFINWIQNNRPENNDKTYAELTNFQYYDTSSQKIQDIETAINDLEKEFEKYDKDSDGRELVEISMYINDYKNDILAIKNKKISMSNSNYVVFNYVRGNKSLSQTMENTYMGVITGAGISSVPALITSALSGPVGLGVFVLGAVGGGSVGANLNTNYKQYIDVVGPEEYYRKCGVLPHTQK